MGVSLKVYNNFALTNLDGLSGIISIGGNLIISSNDALTNLDGLSALTSVHSTLEVSGNSALTNLDGLRNLTSVKRNLYIIGNNSLNSLCGLFILLSSDGLGGDYNVYDNLANPTQQQIIDNGPCITSVAEENGLKPISYKLLQNYPNPFNPQTTIGFAVKELTVVSLKLYNIRGQLVSTLIDKRMQPGQYKVLFNAGHLASGVYFYHIKMGKYQSIKKMILLQ